MQVCACSLYNSTFSYHGIKDLRGRPCYNGQGTFRTFTDFPDFFSVSRQLYPSNKYHIYLDQFDILYFLRGDF